jgi:zinc protease
MAMLAAHLGNHPYARIPIGLPDVIATAPVSQLRAFYDAYYRPERAVLVIAGDIDPARVEARIRGRFSDWAGRGPAGPEPEPILTRPEGPAVSARTIPGASTSSLLLSWFRPYEAPDYHRAQAIEDVVELVGDFALRTRMRADLERSGKPAFDAGPSGMSIAGVARGTVLEARVVSDLDASLAVLVRSHRQLMQYGFTQPEVDEAVTAIRALLQREAAVAAARQTPAIANVTANAVMGRELLISADQKLDLFNAATAGLTAERVSAAARKRFPGDPRLLYFGGSDRIDTARLEAAYAKVAAVPVAAYAAAAAKPWTHTKFGPPGKVASRREESAIGVTLVRFANNVRLTVKPTDWSKGEVQVMVRFGHGQLDLPRDRIAASDWATILLMTGGLKDFTAQELARTMAGKNVYAFIEEADDAFELSNTSQGRSITRPEQLDLQLQLMTAYVTVPGWRPDEWANLETSMIQAAESDVASPTAYYRRESRRLLHAGDIRWVVSEPEMRVGWKPEQAVAHLKPILDTSPLEVIIVGDVTVDAAIAAVSKTLGALPPRPDRPEPKGLRDVRLPAPTATPIVMKHKGPKSQAISGVHWPATDALANPKETQAARLLSELVGARAFEELRVRRGKTYAPDADANLSTVLPGYGEIGVTVITPPEDAPLVYETLDRIAAGLGERELTADEFARLIGPRIETIRREQRTNAYWMENLKDAQTDPRLMRMAETAIRDIQSLTPADLRAVAQKWLVKSKAFRLSIVPE